MSDLGARSDAVELRLLPASGGAVSLVIGGAAVNGAKIAPTNGAPRRSRQKWSISIEIDDSAPKWSAAY